MAIVSVSAYECRCDACGHLWLASTPPATCPACTSAEWNGDAKVPTRLSERRYPERTPVGGIITPH